MKKIVENKSTKVIIEDNIVYVHFKTEKVNLEQAKEIVAARLEAIEEKSYPVLVDIRNVSAIEKDARDYFGCDLAKKGLKAGALWVNSTFSRFMGNFFLKIGYGKTDIPTRLFTDRDEAIKWLSRFN